MRFGRILKRRIDSLLRRSRVEAELQNELDLHIQELTRQYQDAGWSETEARRAARLEFGSADAIKEQCRDTRRVNIIEDFFRDLVYALRLWIKSPGFTLTAVLSLALGIGANTAIFSLVDAVLLEMLPVREPRQLVEITRAGGGTLSYPMFEAIRDRNQALSGVLLVSGGRFAASAQIGRDDAGDVHYSPVSGSYFAVLGVTPVLGRALTEEDLDAANTTVIAHGFWQRAFAGDPGILGKALRLGSRLYTIVGVAPPGFAGVATGHPVDLWVPVTRSRNPVAMMFRVIGRLKPGVSEAEAHANLQLLAHQWSTDWKFERPMQVEVMPASGGLTQLRRRFARPLLVLMTVSALLLLMAALNIANLLMARAAARRREIGVRLSLGAGRGRLIRQLLTESCVLGGAGGLLGLLAAPASAAFLVRFLSSATGTIELTFGIDARILAFTLLISSAVVLLFGMAPALAATRLDLAPMVKGVARDGSGQKPAGPGRLLVIAQVAISCVLLAGAVLFARSLQTLTGIDAGFSAEKILLLHVSTTKEGPAGVDRVRIYDRVLERMTAVPGVRSAAFSSEMLFSGNSWTEAVNAPGYVPQPGASRESVLLVISPRFFETLGTRILRGRDFESRDNDHAPRVAIVNEAVARYYFGDADPVARTFRLEHRDFPAPLTVVGLVQDAKYKSLKESPVRIIYLPALQTPGPLEGANIAVRTSGSPEQMADPLWNAARAESPYLRFGGATTQARLVEGTVAQDRMLAELSGFFGITATILVCLGLYGLTAYQASRRTAEIGVRIALGAQRSDVVRLVLSGSMMLVAAGIVFGIAASMALARLIENLLFGVRAADAVTLLVTPAVLLAVGAAAAYWPARRASRADPMRSLRYE